MKLMKRIFNDWIVWMSLPDDTIDYAIGCSDEGLLYCDGYHATFWYILNLEWYRMNNIMYASSTYRDYFNPDNQFIEPEYYD